MDIKEKVTEVVEKIKKDPELLAQFQKDPVKAVEKVLGVDLPDDLIEKVIDGVKNGDSKDKGIDLGDAIKKLF